MRTISAIGEDDAAPRAYQDGDGLRRVHWRSTARYGELMVRREEHQWRNSASVFLDTRRSAHSGSGLSPTFEFAVSAAASIGAHLAGEGFRARLITEAGEIAPRGTFQDTLLDMLAVISPSRDVSFEPGTSALASAGGQLIAVLGRLSAEDASTAGREQARQRARDGAAAGRLGVASDGRCARIRRGRRRSCRPRAGGSRWPRASTPLAAAWQQLHRPADRPLPVGELR